MRAPAAQHTNTTRAQGAERRRRVVGGAPRAPSGGDRGDAGCEAARRLAARRRRSKARRSGAASQRGLPRRRKARAERRPPARVEAALRRYSKKRISGAAARHASREAASPSGAAAPGMARDGATRQRRPHEKKRRRFRAKPAVHGEPDPLSRSDTNVEFFSFHWGLDPRGKG